MGNSITVLRHALMAFCDYFIIKGVKLCALSLGSVVWLYLTMCPW